MKLMLKFMGWITVPGIIYFNWYKFDPFIKLILLASLIVIVPTIFYVVPMVLEKQLINLTRQQKRAEKKQLEQYIDDVYANEGMQHYQDTHYLFNQLMRAGKLKRNDILQLKRMINDALGSYCSQYNKKEYKNDCHEIYVKLKSKQIDKKEWLEIIQFLTSKAD